MYTFSWSWAKRIKEDKLQAVKAAHEAALAGNKKASDKDSKATK